MPKRNQHLKASRVILGYCTPVVHDILDRYLPIEEHRRTHTPETIAAIGDLLGPEARTEAWLHFFLDYRLLDLKVVERYEGLLAR